MIWVMLIWLVAALILFGGLTEMTIRGRFTIAALWPLWVLVAVVLLVWDAFDDWTND